MSNMNGDVLYKQTQLSNNPTVEYPSKVELTKNTKGYTWTICLRGNDGSEQAMISRMEELNKEMLAKFKGDQ